jgi:hypothetical protein
MKNKIYLSLLICLFIGFCSFSQVEKGTINIESSVSIKNLMTKKVNYNKSNPRIDGFRIQLFNGSESGANSTRSRFLALYPNETISVDWDSPEWKVRVGKYKTRLDVDRALEKIKLAFQYAIVVNMKIRI